MAEGEGEHALLEPGGRRVGHARTAPLARPQALGPVAQHLSAPAIEGRRMHAHGAAGGPHVAELLGVREEA